MSTGPNAFPDPVPRVVAIVGPTASGKSDLGMALAKAWPEGAEIVCCDSMQVYTGLDIGTGKPTTDDRTSIPHHLLDVARPDEAFHAGAWARCAGQVIAGITARGRLPVIVGGTGLYFRALTRGLFEAPPPDAGIRSRHQAEAARGGVPALHARLAGIDPDAAAKIAPNDLVRTSRALEVWEQTGRPITALWREAAAVPPLRCFRVVYDKPSDELRGLIDRRVDTMMAMGFLDEVRGLWAQGFREARALGGLGYKQLGEHLAGACDLSSAIAETKRVTVAYARRQRTWFRQEPGLRVTASPPLADIMTQIRAFFEGCDDPL
ncbi:MAG: tRNA (adenosine(37)-N6)-dimethylallyltransferase MiaA [Myxococcales bacterium]|nr:tRNA (adenosine(37)-N6)-dimethylallyltransferase MiaA [Myxococcales bacterium]